MLFRSYNVIQGLRFSFKVDKAYLRLDESSKNNGKHTIVPITLGRSHIAASLISDDVIPSVVISYSFCFH